MAISSIFLSSFRNHKEKKIEFCKGLTVIWGENGSGVYLDNYCGFQDGEKLLCMDGLYKSVQNQTCIVYSFGLGNDWDFELFMAELG